MTHLVTTGTAATWRINLGPTQAGKVGAFNAAAMLLQLGLEKSSLGWKG